MRNLSLGRRLGLAFLALILMASALILFGLYRLQGVTASLALIGQDRVPKVQELVRISDDMNLIARESRNTLIWIEPERVANAVKLVHGAREDMDHILQQLEPTIRLPEGVARLQAVNRTRETFLPLEDRFLALVTAGQRDEAATLLAEQMRPAQLKFMDALGALKTFQIGLIDTAVADGEASFHHTIQLTLGLLVLMVLASVALSVAITASVVKPVRQAVHTAQRIAQGDLTEQIVVTHRDEVAHLLRNMAAMQQALRGLVQQVRLGADSVSEASAQIAAGNQELSSRTERQASNLQQTAASMEELAGTVSQAAHTASEAHRVSGLAQQAATQGHAVVSAVVDTMAQITQSSERISTIIGTIDGIAFQTNILALNAAVEAARAGEQGRGFAVVAQEVRSLAQRSATAAREIKTLIGDSVERVSTGRDLVQRAGQSMQQIETQVSEVTALVTRIAQASDSQNSGLYQINQAVADLDDLTQRNTALVEEGAAASDSLREQASLLARQIRQFRLESSPA